MLQLLYHWGSMFYLSYHIQLPGGCSTNKMRLQRKNLHEDFEEFCEGTAPPIKFETDGNNLIVDLQM